MLKQNKVVVRTNPSLIPLQHFYFRITLFLLKANQSHLQESKRKRET
jgi:hypothetical protein